MKALVAGWFSFEHMGATAGDLLSRDLACAWATAAGVSCDVAVAPPFEGGVDWRAVDPGSYSHVVFVCGPFGRGKPLTDFLDRFAARPVIGLNLTMLEPLRVWNPFHTVIERDGDATDRPDITFLAAPERVPVVGLVLVHPQAEYKKRAMHAAANEALRRLISRHEMAVVPIDTRLDKNQTGLRTPSEVDALIARMDVVLTTRLHGTVMALRNGVPAIAVDPVEGGAKILRQARTVGWPHVFTADRFTDAGLDEAYEHCLTPEARRQAADCAERALEPVREIRDAFMAALSGISPAERK